jgi:hypothetical protein
MRFIEYKLKTSSSIFNRFLVIQNDGEETHTFYFDTIKERAVKIAEFDKNNADFLADESN